MFKKYDILIFLRISKMNTKQNTHKISPQGKKIHKKKHGDKNSKKKSLQKKKSLSTTSSPQTLLNDNLNLISFKNSNISPITIESSIHATTALLNRIKKLNEESIQREQKIIDLKKKLNSSKKTLRKSKKTLSHFDYTCKRVAKISIFPMVKFISDKSQLDSYKVPGSIGYQFLAELKHEDQVTKHSIVVEGNEKAIWEGAKHFVNDAICEKRNARQTQIKKAFQGWL